MADMTTCIERSTRVWLEALDVLTKGCRVFPASLSLWRNRSRRNDGCRWLGRIPGSLQAASLKVDRCFRDPVRRRGYTFGKMDCRRRRDSP